MTSGSAILHVVLTVSTSSSVPLAWHSSPTPARFWCTPVLDSPCRRMIEV